MNIIILIKNEINKMLSKNRFKFSALSFFIIVFIFMIFLSFYYTYILFSSVKMEMYASILYLAAFISFIYCLFSAFSSKGYLFGFSDFDLLMSLPIKKQDILLSKLFSFILINLFYATIFLLPSIILFGYLTSEGLLYYIMSIVGLPFSIIIPCFLSVSIAIFIKKIVGKSKYQKLFTTILAILGTVMIFIFSFSVNSSQQINFVIDKLSFYIRNFIPFIHFYIYGIVNQDFIMYFLMIITNILAFMILLKFFSNIFINLNIGHQEGYIVDNFKLKVNKIEESTVTLIKREFIRFFNNIPYLMNLGSGTIISILFVGYLILQGENSIILIREFLKINNAEIIFPMALLLILGFTGQTNCINCVSISLEGKNLWILKSLPLSIENIFYAKFITNYLIVFIPSFICYLILIFKFNLEILWILKALIYYTLLSSFVSMSGLLVNLIFPKLDYDREIVVIKQSVSSFISVLGNVIFGIGTILIAINIKNYNMFFLILLLVLFLIDLLLYFLLKTTGVKKFKSL